MNEPENRWRVYRATFDTNIFVRSVIQKENLANHLIALWRERRFILVLSQPIVDEVQRTLYRSSLRRKYQYTLTEVADLINLLYQANVIEIIDSLELCRDTTDNMFIDCAVSGRVQFLVSYDNDLIGDPKLKQDLFEFGVTIISPPDFLEKIRAAETDGSDAAQ